MRIETFTHTGVKPDGTFDHQEGAIETKGRITMSTPKGGCHSKNCNCSAGHWISVSTARTEEGVVEGMLVKFDSQAEMDEFLKNRVMLCS